MIAAFWIAFRLMPSFGSETSGGAAGPTAVEGSDHRRDTEAGAPDVRRTGIRGHQNRESHVGVGAAAESRTARRRIISDKHLANTHQAQALKREWVKIEKRVHEIRRVLGQRLGKRLGLVGNPIMNSRANGYQPKFHIEAAPSRP
jgi:hypothetical protein